jgi:signal recognition particle subunit SEC65
LDETYRIIELAEKVVMAARKLGIDVKIKNVQNPRVEKAEHYYKVDHEHLRKLGFKPTRTIEETVEIMLKDLAKYRDRVLEKSEAILPKTPWHRNPSEQVAQPSFPSYKYSKGISSLCYCTKSDAFNRRYKARQLSLVNMISR